MCHDVKEPIVKSPRGRRVRDLPVTLVNALLSTERRIEERLGDRPRRLLTRSRLHVARSLSHLSGEAAGLAYRIEHREPDPNVDDEILQQRVASTIGPIAKHLDLPHVHVEVHKGIARLEGRTDGDASTRALTRIARGVAGICDVDTSLLLPLHDQHTRPSHGRQTRRSRAFRELTGAVRALDVGHNRDVERLVGSALQVFLAAVPENERTHVTGHLPRDVQHLSELAVVVGEPPKPRTIGDFIDQVADVASRTRGTAEQAVRAVLSTLRDLVPEEVDDIAAVLPRDLAALWRDPAGQSDVPSKQDHAPHA